MRVKMAHVLHVGGVGEYVIPVTDGLSMYSHQGICTPLRQHPNVGKFFSVKIITKKKENTH
jgi:hypothetical protein